MPGFDPLRATRIVATPSALDALAPDCVLRIAPDEALVLGDAVPAIADAHAIVVDDRGFSGRWFTCAEFDNHIQPYIEWAMPSDRPCLVQGLVAAVPAKIWFDGDRILVFCHTAYVHELAERVGAS